MTFQLCFFRNSDEALKNSDEALKQNSTNGLSIQDKLKNRIDDKENIYLLGDTK